MKEMKKKFHAGLRFPFIINHISKNKPPTFGGGWLKNTLTFFIS